MDITALQMKEFYNDLFPGITKGAQHNFNLAQFS